MAECYLQSGDIIRQVEAREEALGQYSVRFNTDRAGWTPHKLIIPEEFMTQIRIWSPMGLLEGGFHPINQRRDGRE